MERKQKFKETKLRSITKVLILRAIVFCTITFFVVVVLGESFTDGIGFAALDIGIEIATHYIYERIWQKIQWGIVIKDDNDPDKTYATIPKPIPMKKIEENNN